MCFAIVASRGVSLVAASAMTWNVRYVCKVYRIMSVAKFPCHPLLLYQIIL